MKGLIENAPKTGRTVLIGGPRSAYMNMVPRDQHWETCHWNKDKSRWDTDSGDAYTDSWPSPVWYRELPND